jgi:hypothetical protein
MFLQEHLAGWIWQVSWFMSPTFSHGSRTAELWLSRIGDMFLQEHCGKLAGTRSQTEPSTSISGRIYHFGPFMAVSSVLMANEMTNVVGVALHFYHSGYSAIG